MKLFKSHQAWSQFFWNSKLQLLRRVELLILSRCILRDTTKVAVAVGYVNQRDKLIKQKNLTNIPCKLRWQKWQRNVQVGENRQYITKQSADLQQVWNAALVTGNSWHWPATTAITAEWSREGQLTVWNRRQSEKEKCSICFYCKSDLCNLINQRYCRKERTDPYRISSNY